MTTETSSTDSPSSSDALASPVPPMNGNAAPKPLTDDGKSNLKWLGVAALAVAALVLLWFFWKTLVLTIAFFGVWAFVANVALRAGKSKILSIGGGLIIGAVAFGVASAVIDRRPSDAGVKSEVASEGGSASDDAWRKVPKDERKSLAEMKYGDAMDLSRELEQFVKAVNDGHISVEMFGRIQTWKRGVAFIRSEIKSAGWEPGLASATAMGRVDSALSNMEIAWNYLERYDSATSAEDRKGFASAHANSLKLMRENLKESRQYMDSGEY